MTAEERVQLLKDRVTELETLRDTILTEISRLPVDQQPTVFMQYKEALDEIQKEYRIKRSEYDILYFTYEYFSEDRNPDNDDNLIPAGVSIEDAPDFHRELCEKLEEQSLYKPTKNIAWAAPRGHAKTMFNSNTYPIHEIVYGKRKFIVIISETADLATGLIRYIADQLKYNEKLRADFGEHLSVSQQLNTMDNSERFETHSGVQVRASSTGKALRGARKGADRPDLIICDDLESQENTNTPEARAKNLHWFNSVIVPIGTPEKTGIIYMGTMVHGSGLLPDILGRAEYDNRVYSAIVEEPENIELWNTYEDILRDKANEYRLEDAENFYEANQTEMDKGAKTLWEDRFSYKFLINKKVEIGSRAYSSEYLNLASDPDSQIFSENIIHYFVQDELELSNSGNGYARRYDIYSFWDIAIGRTKRADYNAIVTVAKGRRTGVVYVIDAWAAKVPMHKAKEVAIQKILEFKPRIFGVESVQAQYEMYRQLQQDCYKQGIYNTRIKPVKPTGKKEERIELLEPMFENGYLKIRTTQRLLKEQLEQFPNADYDDLPDALASCIDLAGHASSRTHQKKPQGV